MDYLLHRNQYSAPGSSPRPQSHPPGSEHAQKGRPRRRSGDPSDAELKRIPVVILTTSRADTDIARTYDLGANSFISKPVAFDSLVKVMKAIGEYWFETVVLAAKT